MSNEQPHGPLHSVFHRWPPYLGLGGYVVLIVAGLFVPVRRRDRSPAGSSRG